MPRASGVLLPVSSLPNHYGVGDFGPSAFSYVDWLHQAGQTYWTILPLLIPDSLGSPFNTLSAFALNWQLISPEMLKQKGLLEKKELQTLQSKEQRIRHREVAQKKRRMLRYAWIHFQRRAKKSDQRDFAAFQRKEKSWLLDYTLYMAMKESERGKPWFRWKPDLRTRKSKALRDFSRQHHDKIRQHAFGQWLAYEQWKSLKAYANKKGVRIFGDLPFAVAHDSVDVWSHPELFHVTSHGKRLQKLGTPPDNFSKTGQLWGSPAYYWKKHTRTHFYWWMQRFVKAKELYDLVRLDHFRGYAANWVIPGSAKTATHGRWEKVPGRKLFQSAQKSLGRLQCVAEDLGEITPDVIALRNKLKFPGMRILQFGLDDGKRSLHYPDNYPKGCVVYTGTHDLPPLRQWYQQTKQIGKMNASRYSQSSEKNIVEGLLQAVYWNQSQLVITQMQDVLGLGKGTRINTPATKRHNWSWRLIQTQLRAGTAARLRALMQKTGRK